MIVSMNTDFLFLDYGIASHRHHFSLSVAQRENLLLPGYEDDDNCMYCQY